MDNADLREQGRALFPGGVSSPVRSFRAVPDEPVPIVRASGSRLFDAEGNEYIDYVAAYGPLILGHTHPSVVAAEINPLIVRTEGCGAVAVDGLVTGADETMAARKV